MTENGNGHWLAALPKRTVVGLLVLACLALGYVAQSWINRIERHVAESVQGYGRLDTLEANQGQMKSEIVELRKDALYSFIAEAEAKRNTGLAEMFRRRLAVLERQHP